MAITIASQTLRWDDGKRQIWSFTANMADGDTATITAGALTSLGANMQILRVWRGTDAQAMFQVNRPAAAAAPVVDFTSNAIDFISAQPTTGFAGGITPDSSGAVELWVEVVPDPANA